MTTVQSSKTKRRTRSLRARVSAAAASPLSMFYKRQQDAVEAARSKGVQDVEVSFSIPGATFVTTVKVKDLESAALGRSRRTKIKAATNTTELVPTDKLRKAIEGAKDVTVFYKTPEQLFDALEKQD